MVKPLGLSSYNAPLYAWTNFLIHFQVAWYSSVIIACMSLSTVFVYKLRRTLASLPSSNSDVGSILRFILVSSYTKAILACISSTTFTALLLADLVGKYTIALYYSDLAINMALVVGTTKQIFDENILQQRYNSDTFEISIPDANGGFTKPVASPSTPSIFRSADIEKDNHEMPTIPKERVIAVNEAQAVSMPAMYPTILKPPYRPRVSRGARDATMSSESIHIISDISEVER